MLAKSGSPFASNDFWYEIKWDGIRGLLFKERDGSRLLSRNGNDLSGRWPAIGADSIPEGTLLDGELVAFHEGAPDFASSLAHSTDKLYIAFDLLYQNYVSVMNDPLEERRNSLEQFGELGDSVALSPVFDDGKKLFRRVTSTGLEGMVAKRRRSTYEPGKRSDSWIKIKPREHLYSLIIGYVPARNSFKSLLLASNDESGALTYLGKVGSGFTDAGRQEIFDMISARIAASPIIPVDEEATWIEPGLFCEVSFAERTAAGLLRSAVFVGIVEP